MAGESRYISHKTPGKTLQISLNIKNENKIAQIYDFTKFTHDCKNLVEGGRILHAGHLLFCEKEVENETSVSIIAFCLETSYLKSAPHKIRGTLLFNGVSEKMQCTYKAGSIVIEMKTRSCYINIPEHVNIINISNIGY